MFFFGRQNYSIINIETIQYQRYWVKQIQSTQGATFQKQTQQKAPLLEIDYKLTEGLQKIGRPLVKRNIKAFLRSFKPSPHMK